MICPKCCRQMNSYPEFKKHICHYCDDYEVHDHEPTREGLHKKGGQNTCPTTLARQESGPQREQLFKGVNKCDKHKSPLYFYGQDCPECKNQHIKALEQAIEDIRYIAVDHMSGADDCPMCDIMQTIENIKQV